MRREEYRREMVRRHTMRQTELTALLGAHAAQAYAVGRPPMPELSGPANLPGRRNDPGHQIVT